MVKWLKTSQDDQPAMRELVVDGIRGSRESSTKYSYNFVRNAGGIFRGLSASGKGTGLFDESSHLKDEFEVHGSNLGFLDGHVDWQKFEPDMDGDVAVPRFGGGPSYFW